jgi:hypothetical protein
MDYNYFNDPLNPRNNEDMMRELNENERMMAGCMQSVFSIIAVAIAIAISAVSTSCKSVEYVPIIEHHTDTLIQTKVQHDSIYINDSTVITEKGDTVKIEKWHTKYVEKQVHDTLYIAKNDTVPQPYPVVKEVPAELSWWQQTRIHIGGIVFWLLLFAVCWYIGGLIRKVTEKFLP